MDNSAESARVIMRVPVADDPAATSEGIWVHPAGADDEYIVDNIPFLAKGLSRGDTVCARLLEGELTFDSVVKTGGRTTYQILLRPDASPAVLESLAQQLQGLGAAFEGVGGRLAAFDVDGSVDSQAVDELLEQAWQQASIWYELRAGR